jgi:hypothetical protein
MMSDGDEIVFFSTPGFRELASKITYSFNSARTVAIPSSTGTTRPWYDLLLVTARKLGPATQQAKLVLFLFERELWTAHLTTLVVDFYKRRGFDKKAVRAARRHAERTRENLDRKGCPLRMQIGSNAVRLVRVDADAQVTHK